MPVSGDKIISVLADSLSVEEIEELLERKKNTNTPDKSYRAYKVDGVLEE